MYNKNNWPKILSMGTNHTTGIPTIEDPDEEGLGPAMLALTKAQRRFVMAMVYLGGSQRGCYIAAGYAHNPDNKNATQVSAHQLAHHPKVQEAMLEVGVNMMGALRIPTVKFLHDTLKNDGLEIKDRIKVAQMVLDRTGMQATQKIDVTHKNETGEQMMKEIATMAKSLGVDPKKLLGGGVIEAEFEEVAVLDDNDISDLL